MEDQPWPATQRVRLAVASMTGTVEHYAQRHASSAAQCRDALGRVAALRKLTPEEMVEALTHTAACYLDDDEAHWYRADALDVLREAGADLKRAQRIRVLRDAQTRIRFGDAEL